MTSLRLDDVRRFYSILGDLEGRLGGRRQIGLCRARQSWPSRGVYFVFEPGEERTTSGLGPRVVRVGTHALKPNSQTTLWGRLRSHRGTLAGKTPGGGNHRGSVFRLHVGSSLLADGEWGFEVGRSWGAGSSASLAVRAAEAPLERAVSERICLMSLLWVAVDDTPGLASVRGYIERNAVALLSNYRIGAGLGSSIEGPMLIDPPSEGWLGRFARSDRVRRSGLWNSDYVEAPYEAQFLDVLDRCVKAR